MPNIIKESFKGFGLEIIDTIRQVANEKISNAEWEERIFGIEKATIAMLEVGVEKDKVISMLQKHWDLRLSEATVFVQNGEKYIQE